MAETGEHHLNESLTISGGTGEFDGIRVLIRRHPGNERYLALQPPEAQPYIVVPPGTPTEEIVAFVQQRAEVLSELRAEMLKHFKKTHSLKCHFKTGDVAHLIGRPFMLRVNPVLTSRTTKTGGRGRFNVGAAVHSDISVIDLAVLRVGNYDQGRAAFISYAKPIFVNNVRSLLEQSLQRVFPSTPVPKTIQSRPMRDAWVLIDEQKDIVWFSESLIPYPAHAIVYAYLVEAIKLLAPDASTEERHALLAQGVSNWQEMKALLADPHNPYAL